MTKDELLEALIWLGIVAVSTFFVSLFAVIWIQRVMGYR